jgi:hypothetical protein
MWKMAAVLLGCAFACAAEDSWAKVKELKTGSDLRVYKKGGLDPITAKSVDVTERKLVVLIKNVETAINKVDVDRVDYQPPAGKAVTTKTYDATEDSASFSIHRSNSRDGWSTIYRRADVK